MIDFLKEIEIEEEIINEIKKYNNDASIFDLSCNEEDCLKIINYLKEIGILNINDLLIYRIDVFKLSLEELVKKFSKFNIPLFVNLINDDFVTIDNIFEV